MRLLKKDIDKNAMAFIIPDGVTTIPERYFAGMVNLENVHIPSSVKSINSEAFLNCKRLKEINIPDSVCTMGHSVFKGCISLTTVKMPSSITWIPAYTFYGCTRLEHVSLPPVLFEIMQYSFRRCTHLKNLNLPCTVRTIRDYAFSDCSSLRTVNLSTNVEHFGRYVFRNCPSFEEIILPNELQDHYCFVPLKWPDLVYYNNIFFHCPIDYCGIFKIPDGISYIHENAFIGCKNITSVIFPDSLKSIGLLCFSKCQSLKTIIFHGQTIMCTPEKVGWNKWLKKTVEGNIVVSFEEAIVNFEYMADLLSDESYKPRNDYQGEFKEKNIIENDYNGLVCSGQFYNL